MLNLDLSINRHRRGETDPYAAYTAAYDFRSASGYLLTTGRVETAYNLAPSGAAYDASQATSGDRPTIGAFTDATEAAVFTSSNEWLEADALAAILNGTSDTVDIDITFESNDLSTQQALLCWATTGSNNGYMTIGTDGTGDIRITRVNASAVSKAVDSAVKITANTTQAMSLSFSGGLVSGYINGEIAFADVDYIGTAGALACDRFSLGARTLLATSLGWRGEISFIGITF